jgi:hypothetical protein
MPPRNEKWYPVLDAELKRWSAKSYDEIAIDLTQERVYEVEFTGKNYQVEVTLLENTDKYLHVGIAVDDGSVPAFISPAKLQFHSREAYRDTGEWQRTRE